MSVCKPLTVHSSLLRTCPVANAAFAVFKGSSEGHRKRVIAGTTVFYMVANSTANETSKLRK